MWECTSDVVSWLDASVGTDSRLGPAGRTILDLGCGAALLGSWALKRGASAVVCQDLNSCVLADVAAPTLVLNGAQQSSCQVALLACSWQTLVAELERRSDVYDSGGGIPVNNGGRPHWWRSKLGGHGVDLVLASEVLYRPAQYSSIVRVLQLCLAPAGVAVIGTKRMYFGAALGGSTDGFIEYARAAGGLRLRVAHSVEDGLSMTRDIIIIERSS